MKADGSDFGKFSLRRNLSGVSRGFLGVDFFRVEKCGVFLLNGLGMGGNPPGSPISWQTFSGF